MQPEAVSQTRGCNLVVEEEELVLEEEEEL